MEVLRQIWWMRVQFLLSIIVVFTRLMLNVFILSCISSALVGLGFLKLSFSWSHSVRHTTVGSTALDEGSARPNDLYLTTHNTQKRLTSIPLAGFKPSQQAIGLQISSLTFRPLGSAMFLSGRYFLFTVKKCDIVKESKYISGEEHVFFLMTIG